MCSHPFLCLPVFVSCYAVNTLVMVGFMQWVKTWSAARGLQGAWLGLLLLQLLRCARACARRSFLVRVVHVLSVRLLYPTSREFVQALTLHTEHYHSLWTVQRCQPTHVALSAWKTGRTLLELKRGRPRRTQVGTVLSTAATLLMLHVFTSPHRQHP